MIEFHLEIALIETVVDTKCSQLEAYMDVLMSLLVFCMVNL